MIEVKHLTKRYGAHTAVSDLSFTIEKGVVYGFLGPNGAGKSTTMNIIAGCLGASDGEVEIDGHNIFEEPTEAKKHIGYLPELPPLYTDMTPEEYLRFVLKAKHVPKKDWEAQLTSVIEKTQIDGVRRRMIRNLSKGYRQRVGIAQALIGDPEVIILDEPTVGLDPAQIIEIRQLIRELGQEHTIILSSHILSEVSAVCDSIMIISNGRLVASDTADNLTKLFAGSATMKLIVRATQAQVAALLADHASLGEITYSAGETGTVDVAIKTPADVDIREELFHLFANAGLPLLEMNRSRASLEDVFLELTKPQDSEAPKKGRKKKKQPKDGASQETAEAPQDEQSRDERPQAERPSDAPKEDEGK